MEILVHCLRIVTVRESCTGNLRLFIRTLRNYDSEKQLRIASRATNQNRLRLGFARVQERHSAENWRYRDPASQGPWRALGWRCAAACHYRRAAGSACGPGYRHVVFA